jgi:hypothetical protein
MPVNVTGTATAFAGGGGVFKRERFIKLLEERGVDVLWEKAIVCPYRKGPSPQDHDINCTACANGYLYFAEESTRMLVHSLSVSENYYAFGRQDLGKATITALPEFKMSFWDRISLLDSRMRYTELVLRQVGGLIDRPKYRPLEVEHLVWVDPRTNTARTFAEGDDFLINSDGELRWLSTTRPDAGTPYAISYFHRPQYIVLDMLHHVRDVRDPDDVVREYPVQALAQLDFNVRNDSDDNIPNEDVRQANPFPSGG